MLCYKTNNDFFEIEKTAIERDDVKKIDINEAIIAENESKQIIEQF